MSQAAFLNRQTLYLRPDPARVVVRPFKPTTEPRDLNPVDKTRANHIVERVLALDPETAASQMADVLENFQGRHRNLLETFEARAAEMEDAFATHAVFTRLQRQLVGAYFMHEYSFEAAALFNPSIVLHPDQSGAPTGGSRFILSLRAVGEGHISSLTFRSGSIAADGSVRVDPTARLASIPRIVSRISGPHGEHVELIFGPDGDISERVIFPVTQSQSNGIEDARFVEFDDGGRKTFYATYTAYTGKAIRSELLETADFMSFRMSPLRGSAARNKGMGLFPRRIDGKYAMIGRQDNENLYLIYSNDLYAWDGGLAILKPRFAWELVQIGNCGSPIELDDGWLLLTHGVGPVRRYSIGAVLLDKADPSKVLARSREPLVRPEPSEREGYVPNVVYTCGAMRHNDQIVLPYAVSDTFSNFATIKIAALMRAMEG
ncbi:MAG: glycoside hydrolase family 130 protein [Geminicoccaceae bacterium]